MSRPLDHLQVVECASVVAGPIGGMTLVQLGASVIRIDPLGGGSDHRRWPVDGAGDSTYRASLDKGRRSVGGAMRAPEGKEFVAALVAQGGVLVDNVVGPRWMSNATLARRRDDLVHVRVQGYPDGRPAVDAEVGIPQITGSEEGGTPVNHVRPAWDLVTV